MVSHLAAKCPFGPTRAARIEGGRKRASAARKALFKLWPSPPPPPPANHLINGQMNCPGGADK